MKNITIFSQKKCQLFCKNCIFNCNMLIRNNNKAVESTATPF